MVLFSISDYLAGVDEKLIPIACGESHSVNWKEYGFQMYIPEHALGSFSTGVIAIRAVVAGSFEFPEGTEPVSAVYRISTSAKLVKPITLKIQHCVALRRKADCRFLSFAVAHVQQDQHHLPCKFKRLEGGSFPFDSQIGTISCSNFCPVAIVKEQSSHGPSSTAEERNVVHMTQGENSSLSVTLTGMYILPGYYSAADAEVPQVMYTLMRFYVCSGNHQYKFDFAAMKRLEAYIQVTCYYNTSSRNFWQKLFILLTI